MGLSDWFLLIHPTIAVVIVFPLLGIVLYQAWLTRSRRLSLKAGEKSPIPASSGGEHVRIGRLLSAAVVLLALIGLAQPIFSKMLMHGALQQTPLRLANLTLIVVATAFSLIGLDRATTRLWRGIFAILTGMGLGVLGLQPEIYRNDASWYSSHYYIGMMAAMLMIFSLTIVQNIYRDRTNRWRKVHIILNSFATLLFIGQGFTGARDLLNIPPSWQTPYIQSLSKQKCKTQPCTIVPQPAVPQPDVPVPAVP
jgi:Protein of unknown function (DUF4079)